MEHSQMEKLRMLYLTRTYTYIYAGVELVLIEHYREFHRELYYNQRYY